MKLHKYVKEKVTVALFITVTVLLLSSGINAQKGRLKKVYNKMFTSAARKMTTLAGSLKVVIKLNICGQNLDSFRFFHWQDLLIMKLYIFF